MMKLFAAVVMVGICGCRTKSVELKPIWPALHDLQAQAAQQQQRVDEIRRDVDGLKRDLENNQEARPHRHHLPDFDGKLVGLMWLQTEQAV